MDTEYIKGMEDSYNLISQANKNMTSLWFEHALFSWQWWLGIFLAIIPWVLWIKFRKKESTNRLLFAGFFVILISSLLDTIGITLGLWSYYHKVVPFSPAFIPWDISLLPVTVMFLLQIGPQISSLNKALGFAAFCAFIAEPLFVLMKFYNQKHWKYVYSFPIYIAIYLASDWLSKRSNFEKLM